jgi:hypothetical protein
MAFFLALLFFPVLCGAQTLGDVVARSRELPQSPGAKLPDFICVNDAGGGMKCSGLLPGKAYPNKVTFFTTSAQPPKDAAVVHQNIMNLSFPLLLTRP